MGRITRETWNFTEPASDVDTGLVVIRATRVALRPDATMHEDFSRSPEIKKSSNRALGTLFVAVFLIVWLWPLLWSDALLILALILATAILLVALATAVLLAAPKRASFRLGILLNRINYNTRSSSIDARLGSSAASAHTGFE